MPKKTWTDDEFTSLKKLYKDGKSVDEISKILNKSVASIKYKLTTWNEETRPIKRNSINFKAIYQDYNWCFDCYINKGMSHKEMAKECGASVRVIQKWCSDKYHLNEFTFKKYKKLTDKQYELVIAGTIGDGHIDKRENYPIYIESHANDEKEYVFWKYNILKDCCASAPHYYKGQKKSFQNGKIYTCQSSYRFQTKAIDQLKEIRNMQLIDKINRLSEFGLSLLLLDDGSRRNSWDLCVAAWDDKSKRWFIEYCKNNFNLNSHIKTDQRYIFFDADSSRIIDKIILNNIPNKLDIIHKKILYNQNIRNPNNSFYIVTENDRIGLGRYCKINHFDYTKTKNIISNLNTNELEELEFRKLIGV